VQGGLPLWKTFRLRGKMCWTWFKTVGHIFKNLGSSQKTLRPMVSQAGYGPGSNGGLTLTIWCRNKTFNHMKPTRFTCGKINNSNKEYRLVNHIAKSIYLNYPERFEEHSKSLSTWNTMFFLLLRHERILSSNHSWHALWSLRRRTYNQVQVSISVLYVWSPGLSHLGGDFRAKTKLVCDAWQKWQNKANV